MKNLVYVVEDEPSIRNLYTFVIEGANMDVKTFESGKEMFFALSQTTPDLFILDIMLEEQDGFQILEKLRSQEKYKTIPIIMVSAKGNELDKVKGFNLGADDYIEKPFGVLELVARIKAKLKNYLLPKDNILKYKDILYDPFKHTITANNKILKLTLKEYNFLKLLIKNSENIVTREEILNKVWGDNFLGETRSIDIHIKEIRKKLSTNNSQVMIETVRGVGYILK
ncbi:response regulator transcription factor [Fusobacterium sp. PH5-44]|uniref:response regulator transcription factor n=1 Tax=unclassified Fusobacterium TaxID=2648384 RepID=UPI003D1F36E4